MSLRVVNKNNEVVKNDTPGELLYKGPGLMKGYGNLPDGSSGINPDGWFPTGDLATMNEDGYINIVGRAKEMIIRGGENLYPIEIENYLLEHPGVLEVAVFGLPDKKYDEECCAVARVDLTKINNPDELREIGAKNGFLDGKFQDTFSLLILFQSLHLERFKNTNYKSNIFKI